MLILPHAYRLGIDFYKFGKRILQSSRNRNRRTLGNVVIGELFRAQFRRRIHRCARFAYDHVRNLSAVFAHEIGHNDLAFFRSGTVTDRNNLHAVFCDKFSYDRFAFFHLVLRHRGVNNRFIEHLARFVDNGEFAARSVSGVPPERNLIADRRLHKQGAQIDFEHFYSLLVRGVGKRISHFAFDRRSDQSFISVLASSFHI